MDVCGAGTTVGVHPREGRARILVVGPDDREALWAAVSASVTT